MPNKAMKNALVSINYVAFLLLILCHPFSLVAQKGFEASELGGYLPPEYGYVKKKKNKYFFPRFAKRKTPQAVCGGGIFYGIHYHDSLILKSGIKYHVDITQKPMYSVNTLGNKFNLYKDQLSYSFDGDTWHETTHRSIGKQLFLEEYPTVNNLGEKIKKPKRYYDDPDYVGTKLYVRVQPIKPKFKPGYERFETEYDYATSIISLVNDMFYYVTYKSLPYNLKYVTDSLEPKLAEYKNLPYNLEKDHDALATAFNVSLYSCVDIFFDKKGKRLTAILPMIHKRERINSKENSSLLSGTRVGVDISPEVASKIRSITTSHAKAPTGSCLLFNKVGKIDAVVFVDRQLVEADSSANYNLIMEVLYSRKKVTSKRKIEYAKRIQELVYNKYGYKLWKLQK